jgi:hypothetical protein
VRPPEVAREHDHRVATATRPREPHARDRGPQDVARVEQGDVHALGDLVLHVVRDVAEHRQHGVRVRLGVDGLAEVDLDLGRDAGQQVLRLRAAGALRAGERDVHLAVERARIAGLVVRGALRVATVAARLALRELFLELRGVEQDQPGQLRGGRRCTGSGRNLRGPAVAAAAVVEVGVGEDDGVERARIEAERDPVAHRLVRPALEHAAVHEDPGAPGVHEMTRTCDRSRPAQEGQLHGRIVTHPRRGGGRRATIPSTPADLLAAAEAAYLHARDARDRLTSHGPAASRRIPRRRARGGGGGGRGPRGACVAGARGGCPARRGPAALAAMRHGVDSAFGEHAVPPASPAVDPAQCRDVAAWAARSRPRRGAPSPLEGCYGAVAAALHLGGATLTRPQVLARLATEPDPATRRRLFGALEPLWRTVDGDGGTRSPYRALLRESAARWRAGGSPIAANASALGVTAPDIEAWAIATLEGWRSAVTAPARAGGEPAVEPWDWWWRAGEADRALRAALPLGRLFSINPRSTARSARTSRRCASASTHAPAGRPAVPWRSRRSAAGRPSVGRDLVAGRATVLASYVDGGLGELTRAVHETGHAIHIAAVRTRPAYADWPDSDALTEALAELVSLDLAEPAVARRRLPDAPAIPEAVSLRCRYADVVMDAAWALLEIRLHAAPDRRPNEVWTEITEGYLGIAPHPEWSWWAIRGQLVQEPGYMANYAIGAVLAADLRAVIRDARGDWIEGDPGWYAWVSDRIYRFGLERPAGVVLRDVLGRAPAADPLLREIGRAGAAG